MEMRDKYKKIVDDIAKQKLFLKVGRCGWILFPDRRWARSTPVF
jgi:hypothetical protein